MHINNNLRHNAFSTLNEIEKNKSYSALVIDSVLGKSEMSDIDRALFTRLVYGVLEKKMTLDYIISLFSMRDLEKTDKSVLMLCRIGAYQILYCDRIPDSAAVNETVSLADIVSPGAKGYVNAVLRSVCREKGKIRFPSRDKDKIKYLGIKYSVSYDICRALLDDYGFEKCEAMLSFCGEPEFTTLRVNTLKTTRADFISLLDSDGVSLRAPRLSQSGVNIKANVNALFEKYKGMFFVQDEASQAAVEVLGAKKGETVVDACACPGGKSFGSAMDMENCGNIFSFDLHANKLSLIKKEAAKLGIDIITTAERDAREPDTNLIGKADRVICDVPCSGLGVLRKKPELRYKDLSESERLPEIQYAILENSAKYLKAGGTLVYSTCTLLKRENEDIIKEFIDKNNDYELCPFTLGTFETDGFITLTPDTNATDGFFIAKIIRK